MTRRRAALVRAAWPAIGAGIVLVVVPPALFGVGYVADRMPLFLALLAAGSLTVRTDDPAVRRAVAAADAIVVVRLAAIAVG
jgi:hypothetical protein